MRGGAGGGKARTSHTIFGPDTSLRRRHRLRPIYNDVAGCFLSGFGTGMRIYINIFAEHEYDGDDTEAHEGRAIY